MVQHIIMLNNYRIGVKSFFSDLSHQWLRMLLPQYTCTRITHITRPLLCQCHCCLINSLLPILLGSCVGHFVKHCVFVCTCIRPGTRLSAVVKMSCLVLGLLGDARMTLPVAVPSWAARINCCLGTLAGSTAVTIWIFCPVCWSVTIWAQGSEGCCEYMIHFSH